MAGRPEIPGIEDPDVRAYMDELWNRLPNYASRAAVPPETPGSIEWLGRTGKFWWELRDQAGLSRPDIAERMVIHINDLRFFEVGLAEPDVIISDLPKRYAESLGKPELYTEFCQKFGIPEIPSPLNTPQ